MKYIDFVEEQADRQMQGHIADMDALRNETHITFVFVITALSCVFGYLLALVDVNKSVLEQRLEWIAPVSITIIWLFWIGYNLVTNAMLTDKIHHRGNEPKNLLGEGTKKECFDDTWEWDTPDSAPSKEKSVDYMRACECLGLQSRIDENRARNAESGKIINKARRLLLLTPLIFLVAVALVAVLAAVAEPLAFRVMVWWWGL